VFDSGGSGVKLEITSSNTGPTPALDVFVHPIISPGPSGAYQPIEILKQAITTTHMPLGLGHALFKGSYFTEDNTPSMALEAFQNIPVLAPHIAIVARYKFSFSDDFHHTAQLYILARIDHQHPGQAFVISPGVEVPANMLRLQLLGSYAD
jgi:hypothetical protein